MLKFVFYFISYLLLNLISFINSMMNGKLFLVVMLLLTDGILSSIKNFKDDKILHRKRPKSHRPVSFDNIFVRYFSQMNVVDG